MRNILCLLRAWYESFQGLNYNHEQFKSLYYVDESHGVKIPYYDVEDIVNGYYGEQEQNERLYNELDEKDDYIRLLRKENQELRCQQNG